MLWRITHLANYKANPSTVEKRNSKKEILYWCLQKHEYDPQAAKDSCGMSAEGAWSLSQWHPKQRNLVSTLYLGINNCAGYAIMFGALARAAGIPTRIAATPDEGVVQNGERFFHFWNEVFFMGQWLVVDATYNDSSDVGELDDVQWNVNENYRYFLLSPAQAGELDPAVHGNYQISGKF